MQDPHSPVPNEKLIYESSNGDVWYLCENPVTTLPAVKHVANPQAGGHIDYLEVENFLSIGRGPEHQALRDLIERDQMATILIAYDIHSRQESGYDELVEAIRSLGSWWHHLETVWIVRTKMTSELIRDELAAHIGADDQLLVVNITGAGMEWTGLNLAGSDWLKRTMNRDTLLA